MSRLWSTLAAALLVATSAALATATPPATNVERPTTIIEPTKCVTPDCHVSIKAYKVIHGPVAVDACDNCHELADPAKHLFTQRRQKAEVCTYCHDFDVRAWPSLHKPVANGECTGCHDPHGGEARTFLREASMGDLCARCHDPAAMRRNYQHSPVNKGACDSCHPPHGSKFPKLLDVVGPDLCLACHVEFDARISQVKHRHKALDKGCVECHEVHASDLPLGIKKPTADLCVGCHEHEKTRDVALTSKFKHSVVMKDRSCLNCHTAHGGDFAKLMADQTARTCLKCHNEPVESDRGQTIAAVKDVADPKLFKHGPIKDGECGGCHAVHGADRPLLMAKSMSKRMYQDFSLQLYELCFGCHDVRLGELANVAGGITGFRNGQQNLHFLHLRLGNREKNCAFCHADHATPGPRLVRETVPFGKWRMPINFRKTDTGGTCQPGCHVPYAYDRERPVPTTAPATLPTTRNVPLLVARPEPEKPREIRWSAVARSGTAVTVPDSTRHTALVFVTPSDTATLPRVAAATKDVPMQVVVIQCGNGHASPADLSSDLPWPVVPDPDGILLQQSKVRGWPTVVLVRPDGFELARLSEAGESLTMKLAAYVDLATAKIDASQLEANLAARQVVTDGPARLTPHRLQVADRFLADDKPDAAVKVLEEALRLDPDSATIKARLMDALITAKRADQAIARLGRLKPGEIPPAEHALLRARGLVALDRWFEAYAAVQDALRLNPDSPEPHHLLGLIAQQDQDWEKASAEFRKASELRRRQAGSK